MFAFLMDKNAKKQLDKKFLVSTMRLLLWIMAESRYGLLVAAQKPAETGASATVDAQAKVLSGPQRSHGSPSRGGAAV
jgi:hypothetical protein